MLLAFLDFEANYLAVKAYQFTDITSVLLLNSLTIPWIVVLSYIVLKRRYRMLEIVAMFICLCGLGLVILSDSIRERWSGDDNGKNPWVGDLFCVASSFLYACQNVLQEYILKGMEAKPVSSGTEYMGMLGLCGFTISVIQCLAFEYISLTEAGQDLWTHDVIGLLLGFTFTMVTLYLLLAWYIASFDASLFNMNILTTGIYGLIFEFVQKRSSIRISSDWIYVSAYILIIAGVVLYSRSSRSQPQKRTPEKGVLNADSEVNS